MCSSDLRRLTSTGWLWSVSRLNLTPVNVMSASADPASGNAGDVYYNTTSNTLKVYNGSAWVAVGGSTGASRTFVFFMGA